MTRTSGGTIPADATNFVSSDTFAGLNEGDRVRVNMKGMGILEKYDGMIYEFVAHVTDINTGKQLVRLWGGPTGRAGWLHVQSTRIKKVDTGKKK